MLGNAVAKLKMLTSVKHTERRCIGESIDTRCWVYSRRKAIFTVPKIADTTSEQNKLLKPERNSILLYKKPSWSGYFSNKLQAAAWKGTRSPNHIHQIVARPMYSRETIRPQLNKAAERNRPRKSKESRIRVSWHRAKKQ